MVDWNKPIITGKNSNFLASLAIDLVLVALALQIYDTWAMEYLSKTFGFSIDTLYILLVYAALHILVAIVVTIVNKK